MQEVLLVIHLIVAIAIIAIVLVQPSESGGFTGNSGSMSNLMAPRRTADALTRATTILAACFFCTSLLLAITASSRPQQQGILEMTAEPAAKQAEDKAVDKPAAANDDADTAATKADDSADAADKDAEDAPTPKAPLAQ